MARQLEKNGHEVALLSMIDCMSPSVMKPAGKIDETSILSILIRDLGGLFNKNLPVSIDKLQHLKLQEQLEYVLDIAKKEKVLPAGISDQQFYGLLQVVKANIQAFYNYVPKTYQGHITLFNASEKKNGSSRDSTMGWGSVAQKVEIFKFSGDHYSILQEPVVKLLAEQLGASIERCGSARIARPDLKTAESGCSAEV